MATFLKKYNEYFKFQSTYSFLENGENIIFGVGHTIDGCFLIVKLDQNGEYLWGQIIFSLNLDQGPYWSDLSTYKTEKIIQLGNNNYVMHIQHDTYYNTYVCLDSDGVSRKGPGGFRVFSTFNPDSNVFIETYGVDDEFCIVESGKSVCKKPKVFIVKEEDIFKCLWDWNYENGYGCGYELEIEQMVTTVECQNNMLVLGGNDVNGYAYIQFLERQLNVNSEVSYWGSIHDPAFPEPAIIKSMKFYNTIGMFHHEIALSGILPRRGNKPFFSTYIESVGNGTELASVYALNHTSDFLNIHGTTNPVISYNKNNQNITYVSTFRTEIENRQINNDPNRLKHIINQVHIDTYAFNIPQEISSSCIIKSIDAQQRFTFNIDDSSVIGSFDFIGNTPFVESRTSEWEGWQKIAECQPIRSCKTTESIQIVGLTRTSACVSYIGNGIRDGIVQSPYVALLAAGSGKYNSNSYDGSAEGIHLRWLFNGKLGENHLPKGNLTTSTHNFNKENDFVKIWRIPYYNRYSHTLDLTETRPIMKSGEEKYWEYILNNNYIRLWFRNKKKYNEVASRILLNSEIESYTNFLKAYGSEMLEVEIMGDEMFFNVKVNIENATSKAKLKVETISNRFIPIEVSPTDEVEISDKPIFRKDSIISLRKTYKKVNANKQDEFVDLTLTCENGHALRYKIENANIKSFEFEFYHDTIQRASAVRSWIPVGDYALTNNNEIAYSRLDPTSNMVNNQWPRFINGTKVKTQSYKNRWDANDGEWDIKKIVNKYLQYSEDEENPRAELKMDEYDVVVKNEINNKPLIADENEEEDQSNIQLIDLLNLGAMDFHIARMLGLGTIDYSAEATRGEKCFYLLEYETIGDIDGAGARAIKHYYLTLPTSIEDERLPSAIEIDKVHPGFISEETNDPNYTKINLKDGYTPDGLSRYVTLTAKEEVDFKEASVSFFSGEEFESHKHTPTAFVGLQHKMNNDVAWRVQDIAYDADTEEIIPLTVSSNNRIIYIHQQRESGTHHYKSYAINIFSRTNKDYIGDDKRKSIQTKLIPGNLLQAPSNVQAYHVREERPCMLSTPDDQNALSDLMKNTAKNDKTLIRLTFDYNSNQDAYTHRIEPKYNKIPDSQIIKGIPNGTENPTLLFPDNMETYADKIYIHFRNSFPKDISGKIKSVETKNDISIITTESYKLSTGKVLNPVMSKSEVANFIGSILVIGEEQYVVTAIDASGKFPKITVKNNKLTAMQIDAMNKKNNDTKKDVNEMQAPENPLENVVLFSMIENMQNSCSWGNTNVNENSHVTVKIPNWDIHRELYKNEIKHPKTDKDGQETGGYDIETVRILQKSRGFWIDNATIAKVNEKTVNENGVEIEKHQGCYSVTFPTSLVPAYNELFGANQPAYINSIQWHNGQIRLKKGEGERKSYDVVLVKKSGNKTSLYFYDPDFVASGNNPNAFGTSQTINYYPGYRVYLYANDVPGLTEKALLPNTTEKVHYSIFGLRSYDSNLNYTSNFCVPAAMFSQRTSAPQKPQKPTGALYATRPDSFGRSSYSFRTKYNHEPDNLLFYRSNDSAILHAIYTMSTVQEIQRRLDDLGGMDEDFINDRWQNFFDFEKLESVGQYNKFPDNEYGYRLPLPDVEMINSYIRRFERVNNINKNAIPTITSILPMTQVIIPGEFCGGEEKTVIDIIKESIYETFVPLTEYPIVYDYIESKSTHAPSNKKQNVRNKDGRMMAFGDEGFDMAPMAKVYKKGSGQPEVLFVDYTIDAGTRNVYFYSSREMNTQMNMGEYSLPVGPIKPVNTNAPASPQIKWALPILKESALDIEPAIEFQINAYPKADNVRKITIYRATDAIEAIHTRTMKNIGSIMLKEDGMLDDDIWVFYDKFTDLEEVPYGDPLYYRITVSREFQYAPDHMPEDSIYLTDYAASEPSKLIMTMIVDNEVPDAPVIECNPGDVDINGKLTKVELRWNKTMYKGKYHIYQMNSQGNWNKLSDIVSQNYAYHTYIIDELQKRIDNEELYYHFKVVAENTSGMLSTEENIFTI